MKDFDILDKVPMGIFILRKDMTVLFWNACLEDWTGLSRQAMVGTDILGRYPHLKDKIYYNRIEPVFEGGPPIIFSSQLHQHIIACPLWNDRLRVQHTTVNAIARSEGKGFHALFAIQDVTDLTKRIHDYRIMHDRAFEEIQARQRAERELQDLNANLERTVNEEIEKRMLHEQLLIQQSKMAAMGEMLSAIAHQWRQPLTILSVFIQDIKDVYHFGLMDDAYIDNIVGKAMSQIAFMSSTIDDFRNFFKTNKGKSSFSVVESVQKTLSLLCAVFKHSKITVTISADSNRDIFACGYPNEFMQVIVNIVNNARDAIVASRQKEGETGKEEGHIDIAIGRQDEFARIDITDNGGGIAAHLIDRIFEPYFTTKEHQKGTGIGLYMAKVIIENNMDGRLSVCNINKGARFTIELPVFHCHEAFSLP